jgi:putative DNA primase/helicase
MTVADLKTGVYRASQPTDYNTKITAVCAAPAGSAALLWLKFLEKVTADNDELIGFLRRFLGYCLTGDVCEQVLVFLYGAGGNGKGVFIKTVASIMGDYALVAPMDMLLTTKNDRHPTEIARLQGVRLVTAQETQTGRTWDEAKIKNLTGADKLTGRFMRGDFFDFDPTHKLMIAGNHKPTLRVVDEAIRRRFLLVPFTVQITEAEKDPKLFDKLKAEWPAILRWMIEGCLEWQRIGLAPPESVRNASKDYFEDQDVLGEWLEARVACDPGNFVTSTQLFSSWKQWCEQRNQFIGTETTFVSNLKDRGFKQARRAFGRGFENIRLKTVSEMEV